MIDCWGPGFPRKVNPVLHIIDHVRELKTQSWSTRAEYLRTRIKRRLSGLRHDWEQYNPERVEGEAIYDLLYEVQKANEKVADGYTPKPYPGRIHVFRALDVPKAPGVRFDDPTCGWRPYAEGGIKVTEIHAAHYNMLDEPHVDQVATELEKLLKRAFSNQK